MERGVFVNTEEVDPHLTAKIVQSPRDRGHDAQADFAPRRSPVSTVRQRPQWRRLPKRGDHVLGLSRRPVSRTGSPSQISLILRNPPGV